MKLILQKHSQGCGIAVLSMITGQSYDALKEKLFGLKGKVEGLYLTLDLKDLIKKEGFQCEHTYSDSVSKKDFLAPIKGKNILFELRVYQDSPCAHFVCMDQSGKIYDPMFGHTRWDFYHVKPYSRLVVSK